MLIKQCKTNKVKKIAADTLITFACKFFTDEQKDRVAILLFKL